MVIRVTEKAHKKIYAYCKNAKQGEIGGLILGKILDTGDTEVRDAILFNQVRTSHNFEIDDESMMEFTKNASIKVLESVIGWWHYHQQFGTFWSTDDDNTFVRLTKLSNFCVGLVTSMSINSKIDDMKMRCRLDTYNREGQYISIDDIQCELPKKTKGFKLNWLQIESEVGEKVQEDNRFWKTCPKCNGYGTVSSTSFKKTNQKKNIEHKLTDEQQEYESEFFGDLSENDQEILDSVVGGQNYGFGGLHKAK